MSKKLKKPSRISCQSVLIPRKISGTFYAEFLEKYMEFEENNVEIGGNSTRNLKEKHKEFFTRVNKESYFRKKLNTAYNQLQFYSKVIKHVINNFLIYLIINQRILKNR
jgi:hypothetical protein